MSKITMQQLADAAGVSRITVWKVLNDRPGVSEALRCTVRQKAQELGFELPQAAVPKAEGVRTFAIAVARPESSIFWMNIIHHIAKELAKSGINMMYTYMPTVWRKGYTLPMALTQGTVEGFIVLNVYDKQLLEMLAASPMPKVFLDVVPSLRPDQLNGDLVMLESQVRVQEITARLLRSGRRRLGFIGDVNYAQTNLDRYHGFLLAHEAEKTIADPTLSLTEPLRLHEHYEQISAFLSALEPLPDGIVCASDFIASFAARYFAESGRELPPNFVLTGFDNSTEYPAVAGKITTVDVDTSALGRTLARKLIYRVDYPAAPAEVTYIATKIIERD